MNSKSAQRNEPYITGSKRRRMVNKMAQMYDVYISSYNDETLIESAPNCLGRINDSQIEEFFSYLIGQGFRKNGNYLFERISDKMVGVTKKRRATQIEKIWFERVTARTELTLDVFKTIAAFSLSDEYIKIEPGYYICRSYIDKE